MSTVPPSQSDHNPSPDTDGSRSPLARLVRESMRVMEGRGALILSLLAVAVLSVPVFLARFPNDMDYYTIVANKVLHGGRLYRDVLDTKPPLIFLHYALVFRMFGAGNITPSSW